jgi:hypothetical protein|nr:MAG TPA: hypothetical protein [Caudoviricetes sp.]
MSTSTKANKATNTDSVTKTTSTKRKINKLGLMEGFQLTVKPHFDTLTDHLAIQYDNSMHTTFPALCYYMEKWIPQLSLRDIYIKNEVDKVTYSVSLVSTPGSINPPFVTFQIDKEGDLIFISYRIKARAVAITNYDGMLTSTIKNPDTLKLVFNVFLAFAKYIVDIRDGRYVGFHNKADIDKRLKALKLNFNRVLFEQARYITDPLVQMDYINTLSPIPDILTPIYQHSQDIKVITGKGKTIAYDDIKITVDLNDPNFNLSKGDYQVSTKGESLYVKMRDIEHTFDDEVTKTVIRNIHQILLDMVYSVDTGIL